MIKNFSPSQDRDWLIDGEVAPILACILQGS